MRFAFWRKNESKGFYDSLAELIGQNQQTKAGEVVTMATMWKVSAALACIRARASGVAQVPFKLFQEYEENGLKKIRQAKEHPLFDKIAAKPNDWQTSFEFREQLEAHLCLGNAFVYLNRYRGAIEEMFILSDVNVDDSDKMNPRYYASLGNGSYQEIPRENIWHIRGLSWDGLMGMDTLKMAREALGLSVALDRSVSDMHANGVKASGIYSVDGSLSQADHEKITLWLKNRAKGSPLVLDRSAKWSSMSMSSVDSQHKEMRDYQIEEVCRFFNVFPIMIGHSGDKSSTYASAEAMFTAHKVHTLHPEYARIQESADVNLLTDQERKDGYYHKFVVSALSWASIKDQTEYYARSLGAGGSPAWHTQDEIRAFQELNPFGGDAGMLPKSPAEIAAQAKNRETQQP